MNAEWKEKWCEALESDRYLQTDKRLKGLNEQGQIGFCCLGVAANRFDLNTAILGEVTA